MSIHVKRIYDLMLPEDGIRILVDRLWPRGVSKVKAHIDFWMKEIAPSTNLRQWFNHDPQKWSEFRDRYFSELRNNVDSVKQITNYLHQGRVTLVYGAKDREHNNAIVLKEYLEMVAIKREPHG